MRRFFIRSGSCGLIVLVMSSLCALWAQQTDVPEPAFMSFSVNAPYVPVYKGRDPFKPLGVLDRSNLVSIGELRFNGVMKIGDLPVALFAWRGSPNVRYTLRLRKLFKGDDTQIDGVIGDITDSEVVLIQGERKIVYPRTQRRP